MNAGRASAIASVLTALCGLWCTACSNALPERVCTVAVAKPQPHALTDIAGKKVLLVHSYHTGYPWVNTITRGVQSGLAGSGVDLHIHYMDTKRRTDEPWKVRAGELAMEQVKQWSPDLVIAVDDNAQQYFGKQFVDGKLPLVFCGVNVEPSQYGYPAANVTGVIERPFFKETLALLQQIRPIHKVAVLSCEDSSSLGAINFIKEQIVDCEVETRLVNDFDEWKKVVEEYNGRVDALGIYVYHTIREKGNPVSLDPQRVMQWTVEHARIPTMGYVAFGVEDGLMLGVAESGEEQGEKAAHYAVEILRGTPISSLPVRKANRGTAMFNVRTAARLGIALPEDVRAGVQLVSPEQR
jgi:ABC-type uncharacterized transport system substrate-binding protein